MILNLVKRRTCDTTFMILQICFSISMPVKYSSKEPEVHIPFEKHKLITCSSRAEVGALFLANNLSNIVFEGNLLAGMSEKGLVDR